MSPSNFDMAQRRAYARAAVAYHATLQRALIDTRLEEITLDDITDIFTGLLHLIDEQAGPNNHSRIYYAAKAAHEDEIDAYWTGPTTD